MSTGRGEIEKDIKPVHAVPSPIYYSGQLELTSGGDSGKQCRTCSESPTSGVRGGGVYPPAPVSQWLRATLGGVDSLALLAWCTLGQNRLQGPRESPWAKNMGAGFWKYCFVHRNGKS